ncbi:transporter Sec61 subunit gamma [Salpingoeca rosetta]|uniref:Transporter Sec61 subunit gamma n=1 Tax=Salpingoeca rosetta (strain ATCC 50818 / BSB-021) TaxID=946362 RepID=F2TZ93_SALR5|nr:transporter Sec61 subunit gamma [Salpingoeca rosetta]EGD78917.1 transporter Sec61 subunit gamma [Salpingoeca rosetta]|eukprot:XP_004997873.1 transporter Sec61 subunit gamma [Salpingoeca rosetta]
MDEVERFVQPLISFAKSSITFFNNCQRPNSAEYQLTALMAVFGLLVLGFLGFFVKLIHIPINNIIVS